MPGAAEEALDEEAADGREVPVEEFEEEDVVR